jgi:peptide/nickel transport system substrate-binding protein
MPFRPLLISVVAALSVLAGCVPSGPSSREASLPAPERSAAPKSLTIGIQREPVGFNSELQPGVTSAGGATQVLPIVHDYLVVEEVHDVYVPRLATSMIALEDGSWRMNPDGTMETTWRLRPEARWHDGARFTADDLVFAFAVYKDPEIPNQVGGVLNYMTAVTAPDSYTLVVHWSQPYVRANEAAGLTAIPKHLLEESYLADRPSFPNSPRFTTEFIGLGPFRLLHWEPGTSMEFARFDDYFVGRPRLDRVLVRFLSDPNTMIANILAGSVDVLLPTGVDLDAAVEISRRWEGSGHQIFYPSSGSLRHLEIQHRLEYEKPRHSTSVRAVRQALYHAIDRAMLVETVTHSLSPSADSWFPPNHALRPQLEASIPQFPYDPVRAQQIMAQAGWSRGGDGVLVHTESGERFEIQVYGSQVASVGPEQGVIGDGWKTIGAQVAPYVIPSALGGDREFRSKLSGAGLNGTPTDAFYTDRLHSRYITSPANRWIGGNRGGYSNPAVDVLLDRLIVTVDSTQRIALHRELLGEQMGDVALMPLYWDIRPTLALRDVRGIRKPLGSNMTWNIWEWDRQEPSGQTR